MMINTYDELVEVVKCGGDADAVVRALNTKALWDAFDHVLYIAARQNNVNLYRAVVMGRLEAAPEAPIFGLGIWDEALEHALKHHDTSIMDILLGTVHANEESVNALLFEVTRFYWHEAFPETYHLLYQLWCDAPLEHKEACLARRKRDSRNWQYFQRALAEAAVFARAHGQKGVAPDVV